MAYRTSLPPDSPTLELCKYAIISDWRVARMIDLISISPPPPHTFKELGEEFGLSPAHLGRLFKAQTGYCFNFYVRSLKMSRAAIALLDPATEIKQVSAAAGYRDPANFTHDFKRYFGLTPRQFRMHFPPPDIKFTPKNG